MKSIKENESVVEGYVPTVGKESVNKREEDSVDRAEKQKLEKVRTRIEIYEKRLPMKKLTIAEWIKAVNGGDELEPTTTLKDLIKSLHLMKDATFWKSENILDEKNVFVTILKE